MTYQLRNLQDTSEEIRIKILYRSSFIVIDGAMTEVIRPCLYGAYHHVELAEPSRAAHLQNASDQSKLVWDVVGPVCESADFIGKVKKIIYSHSTFIKLAHYQSNSILEQFII